MSYTYAAYGLTLQLCFPCSLLPEVETTLSPDVVVTEGTVPRCLEAPVVEDASWEAEPGRFLWRGGRKAGRFLVEEGRQVTLERNVAAVDERLASQFVNAILVAVLRQRGLLVLHASTAWLPSGAVAICGLSGAGKSTTLCALLAHGASLLADDVTALRIDEQGQVEALPGVAQLRLCWDATERLRPDTTGALCTPGGTKAVVRPLRSFSKSAVPLRALTLLQTHSGDDVRVNVLRGVERFAALQDCVYGPLLPEEHPGRFALFAKVAEQAAIVRIERPAGRWSVEEVVEAIRHG